MKHLLFSMSCISPFAMRCNVSCQKTFSNIGRCKDTAGGSVACYGSWASASGHISMYAVDRVGLGRAFVDVELLRIESATNTGLGLTEMEDHILYQAHDAKIISVQ